MERYFNFLNNTIFCDKRPFFRTAAHHSMEGVTPSQDALSSLGGLARLTAPLVPLRSVSPVIVSRVLLRSVYALGSF